MKERRTHAVLMGDFIESKMPIQAVATLTSPVPRSSQMLNKIFLEWIAGVQRQSRLTIGYVRADERTPQLHIHAALLAARPLDCPYAKYLWQSKVGSRYTDAAVVETFRGDAGGLAYILKTSGDDADAVQFSENLTAFSKGALQSALRSSNQRRQCRRIRSQMLSGA